MNTIKLENVEKNYGTQSVLKNVSFAVRQGEIIGLLGPNGAGKSTLMKIITGYIKADSGTINILGNEITSDILQVKSRIGYLPEHNPLYLDMYVREYLNFIASVHKVPKNRIEDVIEQTGLLPEAHKKIGQLSKGYRQRTGLAAALIHDPEILILDEPTTGLDPNQLVEIRSLIKELGKDKTIILSTHIMQEVEFMADRVLIIHQGKILADEKLKKLQKGEQQIIEVEFDTRIEREFLDGLPYIEAVENLMDHIWCLAFSTLDDMRPVIFDFANEHGLKILQMHRKNKNLEQLFKEITGKGNS
jgi:ABC-2 type transport system ATP-binding protein